MNTIGGMGGGPCTHGNDNTLMMLLMLMIMCPGMLGGMGDNSMMFFLLLICMCGSGGKMF